MQSNGDKEFSLNMARHNLSSGIYLYRLSGTGMNSGKAFSAVKKMVYAK